MNLNLLRRFGRRWNKGVPTILVVPVVDDVTRTLAEWSVNWVHPVQDRLLGPEAHRDAVLEFVASAGEQPRLVLFAGHGVSDALLTAQGLGKTRSNGRRPTDTLFDADDVDGTSGNLHTVAWACHAGVALGERHGRLPQSGFLGFNSWVEMVARKECSVVWGTLIGDCFEHIAAKGRVDPSDREWLKERLLRCRKEIKDGVVSTGIYDRLNRILLKRNARRVMVNCT